MGVGDGVATGVGRNVSPGVCVGGGGGGHEGILEK